MMQQAKIQKRSKVEIQPKKKKIENPMITKMKQHILNTGRLIEEFFELIQREWHFPKIIDRITDHYPDGNDKPRSVINAWFSVYNYFIKCHHTYISNSSDDKTTIKIINQIMKTKIIAKSPGKIDIMDRNDNNKVKTIVQPLDQKFYDMLLIDIDTKLKPPTEWLNDNIIDLYGKFIESNNEINIFVFSTSFGSKLFAFNNKLDLEGVKTHAKNVNIFEKNFFSFL